MLEAVFISDLHLHPDDKNIAARFNTFVDWAATHTKSVYILGDFFHVWAGDDALNPWSQAIAQRLKWLSEQNVALYYMHGNRDFLMGKRFFSLASLHHLKEPTVITLGQNKILLVHGDRYCTNDKSHQWLRRLTRNIIFSKLFLYFPLSLRNKLVNSVRQYSHTNRKKTAVYMDVVPAVLLDHMHQHNVTMLIHGHIHKSGLTRHFYKQKFYLQYVLSDWDDTPALLCYDSTNGFYFKPLVRT